MKLRKVFKIFCMMAKRIVNPIWIFLLVMDEHKERMKIKKETCYI